METMGGEIQGAFYFGTSLLNPNEAGDRLTFRYLDQSLKHGSPILRFENQGNTQYTRAIPLDWDPTQYGGDQDHPVIWDSLLLGKDLTLNFQNLGPVAQYTTHLTIPNATHATLADPAGYLVSSFNRFWTYEAQSKVLTEVTTVMPDGCTSLTDNSFGGYAFFADFGGIIMSDATGANAMGSMASTSRMVAQPLILRCGSSTVGETDLRRAAQTIRLGVPSMEMERMWCSPPVRALTTCT